ncbi:GNAT superfamily N-acetyltransferase [Phytomonospora endophytica]|uniref:GNAT superfamily N-acetyltransferase n=2 Tax=Phytomonospora endophytica TaxID=714109 RepID=A0A841G138_9ACTN|nr:GNAT superfamily N-acetyltransferase [Phytomonospora endophytica]
MRIEALHVDDDAAVRELAELRRAVLAHDEPEHPGADAEVLAALLRAPRPGNDFQHWIVRSGDSLVGYAELMLPQVENRTSAQLEGHVHPDHRRRGIGTALYRHCAAQAVAEKRTRISAHTTGHVTGGKFTRTEPGVSFLSAMGLTRVLDEVRSGLDLATVDDAVLDRLNTEAWAKAAEYELLTWIDRAPESLAEGVAYLEGRMGTDVPTGDLDIEPQRFDLARWRAIEDVSVRRLRTTYYAAARHVDTDEVAAWTGVVVPRRPRSLGHQTTTIVDPAHRGRRLGTLVKLGNLARLRADEPELRSVETYNSVHNTHMIAINEAMGFVVHDLAAHFQGDL